MSDTTTTNPSTAEEILEQERRITDAGAARSIYEKLVDDDRKRRATRNQTRNQLEGGLPFNPAVLRERNELWRTNVNFRDAETQRDRALQPFWQMTHDVPHRAAFDVKTKSPDKHKWEASMQEAFDEFYQDWGSSGTIRERLLHREYVDYGTGILYYDDPDSPRYEVIKTDNILFPKQSGVEVEDWEIVCVESDMKPSQIAKLLRDPKRAEDMGWSVKQLKRALVAVGKQDDHTNTQAHGYREYDYQKRQNEIRNNDLTYDVLWDSLKTVDIIYRELDGKISRVIIPRTVLEESKGKASNDDGEEFLYYNGLGTDSMSHIFNAILWEVGEGQIHGIKGFGIKNYGFSVIINRLKSRIHDAAVMALAMNFGRKEEASKDRPTIQQFGPFNIFPQGLEQFRVYPDLNTGISVLSMSEMNMSENNAQYKDQKRQIGETETAAQAKILANIDAQADQVNASLYLSQVSDGIYTEQARRLRERGNKSDDAKKFVKRLKEAGVPDEVIHETEVRVSAWASPATATAATRTFIFEALMELRREPGMNSRWILENFIANLAGSSAVRKAMMPEGQDSNPDQTGRALLENMAMGSGEFIPADPGHDHVVHINIHLGPLEAIAQRFQQGQQPSPDQLIYFETGMPHIEEHLSQLQPDETRSEDYRVLWNRYTQVRSFHEGIKANIERQRQ